MAKRKAIFPEFDLPPDENGSPAWQPLFGVTVACQLMHCSRQTFYNRVRDGVYLVTQVRSTDPKPKEMLFRMPDLLHLEERRINECLRRGEKTGWEPAR